MSRSSKDRVVSLLRERNFEELAGLVADKEIKIGYVYRLLYNPDELLRWRAIEAIGRIAQRISGEDPEAVRVILRTLLWTVNDESGGIGWGALESMAEIIYRQPYKYEEFASVILLTYTDEELLKRGLAWAAGRIAQARPELVREALPGLMFLLDDPDPVVRGYMLSLMGFMGQRPEARRLESMLGDQGVVPVYEEGELRKYTLAEIAWQLVEKINAEKEIQHGKMGL